MFRKKEEAGSAAGPSYVAGTRPAVVSQPKSPPPRIFDVSESSPTSEPTRRPPSLEMDEPEANIGAGVVVRGALTFSRYLRIDGTFEGELSPGSKLFVGPTGRVKADLKVDEAIIEGEVTGALIVAHRLELRGNAKVLGNIETRLLSIDEGATVVGGVKVHPSAE